MSRSLLVVASAFVLLAAGVVAVPGMAYAYGCSLPAGMSCTAVGENATAISVYVPVTSTLYLSTDVISFGMVVNGQSSPSNLPSAQVQWYTVSNDQNGVAVGIEPLCVTDASCATSPGQLQDGSYFIPDDDLHVYTTGPTNSGTNADGYVSDTALFPHEEVNVFSSSPGSGPSPTPGDAGTAANPVTDQWVLNVPVSAPAGNYSQEMSYVLQDN